MATLLKLINAVSLPPPTPTLPSINPVTLSKKLPSHSVSVVLWSDCFDANCDPIRAGEWTPLGNGDGFDTHVDTLYGYGVHAHICTIGLTSGTNRISGQDEGHDAFSQKRRVGSR